MNTRYLSLASPLAILVALTLSACGDKEPQVRGEREAIAVHLQEVQSTQVPQAFRYSGTLQGSRKVQLSTKMLGRIAYLSVEEGDRVRRGQTLVRIQSEDIQAQSEQVRASLLEAESALTNAETNHRRMKTLFESESATQKELDDATTHYEISKSRLAGLNGRLTEVQDALGYTVLTAPIDGYVVRKSAEQGDMASPGIPLLSIEDTDNLEVIAQVPESDIDRFAVNDTVAILVGAAGNIEMSGIVSRINPSGHAGTRQFRIHAQVNGDTSAIRSGMFARLVLRKGARSVIAVPETVLVYRGQLTGLFTIDGEGRALLRWVRTGKRFDDRVEILSGLAEGERFVASFEGRLSDGQRVSVIN